MGSIAKLYVQGGDIRAFLESERKRFDRIARYKHMIQPDMVPTLESVLHDVESTLQNPEKVQLTNIPFAASEMDASYSIINESCGYEVEVYAPEPNKGIVETIKGMLEKHNFEVNYK